MDTYGLEDKIHPMTLEEILEATKKRIPGIEQAKNIINLITKSEVDTAGANWEYISQWFRDKDIWNDMRNTAWEAEEE